MSKLTKVFVNIILGVISFFAILFVIAFFALLFAR